MTPGITPIRFTAILTWLIRAAPAIAAAALVLLLVSTVTGWRLWWANGALRREAAGLRDRLSRAQVVISEQDARILDAQARELAAGQQVTEYRTRLSNAEVTLRLLAANRRERLIERVVERRPLPPKPGPKPLAQPKPGEPKPPGEPPKPEPEPGAGTPLLPPGTDVSAAAQIIIVRLDDGSLARACRHPIYGDDVLELVRLREGDPLLSRNPCVRGTEERLRLPAAEARRLWTWRVGIGASLDLTSLIRPPRVYAFVEAERVITIGSLDAFCRGRFEQTVIVNWGDRRLLVECGLKVP